MDAVRPVLTAITLYTHIEILSPLPISDSTRLLQELAGEAPEWALPWYEDALNRYGRKVRYKSYFDADRLVLQGPIGPRRLSMTTIVLLSPTGASGTRADIHIHVSRKTLVELLMIAAILIIIGALAGGTRLALIALAAVGVLYAMLVVRARIRALATARILAKMLGVRVS